MTTAPLEVVALAALWVWALWSPDMRSLRTIVLLCATTVIFAGLAMSPGPIFVVLRVVLLCSVVLTLLLRPDLFFTRSPHDLAFDLAYSRVQQTLSDLARRRLAGTVDRERFASGIGAAVAELKRIDPPDSDWVEIHRATIADLEQWLVLGGGDPTVPAPVLHMSAIETRHRSLRERRRHSWRRHSA